MRSAKRVLRSEFRPSVATVETWFKKFRSEDFNLEHAPREGRLPVADDELLTSMFEREMSFNAHMFAEQLNELEQTGIIL